jgi:3-oxoacyl-[acyl-carrier protein] reductase
MSEIRRLEGRVALVTGSSRGIGASIAKLFAKEGAQVAVHGRDESALEKTRNEIEAEGLSVVAVSGDVTRSTDLEQMRAAIEGKFGAIDVLVANAGGNLTPPTELELIPEEGWRSTVDENLLATFLTLKTFLPGMKDRKRGNVITVSSAAARRANAKTPIAYAAAKAGIIVMTQHVAAQSGPFGVRVNCIAPETILTENNLQRIPQPQQEAMREQHPIRRLGLPDDVAQTALYLASEQSAWITGLVIDVAGGAVMV